MKFTKTHTKTLSKVLNEQIKNTTQEIYGENIDISEHISAELRLAIAKSLELRSQYDYLANIDPMVSDTEYRSVTQEYTLEQRSILWYWRRVITRTTLLRAILENKKSVSYLVKNILENVVKHMVYTSNSNITLSQLVHNSKLQTNQITLNGNKSKEIGVWGIDTIRLQLISEIAECNLLDMKISNKTHTLVIPASLRDNVSDAQWRSMISMAAKVQRKTVLEEPEEVREKELISRSSWWYNTPKLSSDQHRFVDIMNSTEFAFVEDASEVIEERFKEHLKVEELPMWAKNRVQDYQAQIEASNSNGQHYISGSFDSALRWYWQAEIGHNQSSSSLRTLVRAKGIKDPIKYDMSNNVVQMYALGLKSKNLAQYVSLVGEDECKEDLRYIIACELNKSFKVTSFNKDNVKPIFMVWAYNGGKNRLLDGIIKESVNFFTGEKEQSTKVPGLRDLSGHDSDDIIWATWNNIMYSLVPEIVELKKVVNNLIRHNPLVEASWVLPDGAVAQYASVETMTKTLHWVTSSFNQHQHTHYRKQLVVDARAAGLLPRMIHSIDAYIMRQLVLRAHDKCITIVPNHDSFTFEKEDTDTVFKLVRELLVEVMEGNVLHDILQQYNKAKVPLGGQWVEREELLAEDILKSFPMKLEED